WVAMSDYQEEIRIGKEILARVVEAYRKLRNTLRYLIANLYDFNPATDMVPVAKLEEVDRYILARYADLAVRVLDAYDEYNYSAISQAVNQFATVDLSAFYNDISKDRLYTFAARSPERRSGQTAMYLMADGLTRLLAPILSFTADELWRFMPGGREESVHLALFPTREELEPLRDAAADAVHRLGGRGAAGARRRGGACRGEAARHHRARRRGEMRAVLALRPEGLDRSGPCRPVRTLPGRDRRDHPWKIGRASCR